MNENTSMYLTNQLDVLTTLNYLIEK